MKGRQQQREQRGAKRGIHTRHPQALWQPQVYAGLHNASVQPTSSCSMLRSSGRGAGRHGEWWATSTLGCGGLAAVDVQSCSDMSHNTAWQDLQLQCWHVNAVHGSPSLITLTCTMTWGDLSICTSACSASASGTLGHPDSALPGTVLQVPAASGPLHLSTTNPFSHTHICLPCMQHVTLHVHLM